MIIPTRGQIECVENLVNWHRKLHKQDFVYTGPAGSGKTTLTNMFMDRLRFAYDEVLFVTFTGKAASILMLKGFNASTIHSAFFEVKDEPLYEDGKMVFRNGRIVTKPKFVKRQFISSRIKLIVVDEVSMVDKTLRDAIYSFNIPVIGMGDEYQLPAIFGESPFFDCVDYRLWEITRQAQDSGIIELGTLLREGRPLPRYRNFRNNAWVMSKKFLTDKHLLQADMILTAKNKTRDLLNERVCNLHGSISKLPKVGDKLVCRKNNWNKQLQGVCLVNGTIGKVVNPISRAECDLKKGIYTIDYQPDYAVGDKFDYYEALKCDYEYLNSPSGGGKVVNKYNPGVKLERGEAITVHMSQGSQYPTVVYYDEIMGDALFMRRLRYTAITRGVDRAYMFI